MNDVWDVSLEKMGTYFAVLFVFMNIWATNYGLMASAALETKAPFRNK